MTAPLRAIPGENGLPVVGHTLQFIRNCNSLFQEMHGKYGPVYFNRYLSTRAVHLMTPSGNEFVLLDRDKNFSSRRAWNKSLRHLFPNGLMLRDGDEHRQHRRLMGAPFKASALKGYVEDMNPSIASTVTGWGLQRDFRFYRAIKALTLDLAANIFVGQSLSRESQRVNRAFVDMVDASMVVVRYPMLGNKYQRGLEGRAYLVDYFGSRIAAKKQSDDTDMFAEICRAQDDDGTGFSHQDIIDHIIFLMMAAHDTTTSALSSVCFALAKHPEWQARIRDEARALGGTQLSYEQMPEFESAELVFKEALRLYPPLPVIPRQALQDCEFEGFQILRGDQVFVSPYWTHRTPEIWTNPEQFDPGRFNAERAEDRIHKHAWIPFGGGAHKCLGLRFADFQVKLVLFHLLRHYEISVKPGYEMPYQPAPIGKPIDLLPLQLKPIHPRRAAA